MKRLISIILHGATLTTVFVCSTITASAETTTFQHDGYEFILHQDGTLEIDNYIGTEKELTIPDTVKGYTVTCIGFKAFADNEHITSVTIPETTTVIESWAFNGCTNLASITIPDTVTTIRDSFEDTKYYNSETNWENGALYIGNHFVCTNSEIPEEYTVKDGTISIGKCVDTYIDKLTVPASVKNICIDSPSDFSTLKEINISDKNEHFYSIDGVLFEANSNILLRYPLAKDGTEYKIPDGTLAIGPYAFDYCKLTSITISASVKEIITPEFQYLTIMYGCPLEEINVDSKNEIFYSVDGVLFDKQNKQLVKYPIKKPIIDFKIPDDIEEIHRYAFYDCELKSLSIPASLTNPNMSTQDFNYLEDIIVDNNSEHYYSVDGVLFEKQSKKILRYPLSKTGSNYTIPDDIQIIGVNAFDYCSLKSITIPASATSIEADAFNHCKELTDITILNPNCSINGYAIYACEKAKIHGYDDSTANKFAVGEKFKFISMGKSELITKNNPYSDSDFVIYLLNSPAVKLSLVAVLILLLVLLFIKSKKNKKVANQQIISTKANSDEITPDQITPDQILNQITLDLDL